MTYYEAMDVIGRMAEARWNHGPMPEDTLIEEAIKVVAAARVPHGFTREELHTVIWWMVERKKNEG